MCAGDGYDTMISIPIYLLDLLIYIPAFCQLFGFSISDSWIRNGSDLGAGGGPYAPSAVQVLPAGITLRTRVQTPEALSLSCSFPVSHVFFFERSPRAHSFVYLAVGLYCSNGVFRV
ncbi:hypothetical protein VTI74DRAFT_7883 [Chaetomium olivicolor]